MGNCCAAKPSQKRSDLDQLHVADQLIASEDLPPGWKAVPSRSRPGKVAYQNVHTGERISWIPKEAAAAFKGAIKKQKKKKKTAASGGQRDKLLNDADKMAETQQAASSELALH
jgi:hypothetical protein